MNDLASCLPDSLRAASPTITRIGAGMSGAGVYRVEAAGSAYVLKVADAGSREGWHARLAMHRAAAAAGVAPAVIHVDEARFAVLSELVADRGFPMLLMNPATRAAGLDLIGTTLHRVHALPLPADAAAPDPLDMLAGFWASLAGFALPGFVADIVERMRAEPVPPRERAVALCHNDVNPTNLAFDGERLLLLDWDVAGPNDPLYDIATVAMFMRLDDDACRAVLSAHDGAPVAALPPRFHYLRRLVAVLAGCALLQVARRRGYPGSTAETLEATPALIDVYQRMRAGTLSSATPQGQWTFALALIKTGARS